MNGGVNMKKKGKWEEFRSWKDVREQSEQVSKDGSIM